MLFWLYDTLFSTIYESVGIREHFSRSSYPPWFNREIKLFENEKNELYKKFSKSESMKDYSIYAIARHRFNEVNLMSYYKYIFKVTSLTSLRYFNKLVNSARKVSSLPSNLSLGRSHSANILEIVNYFLRNYLNI